VGDRDPNPCIETYQHYKRDVESGVRAFVLCVIGMIETKVADRDPSGI